MPLVLNISQANDLIAAPMRVEYDPKLLRLVKVLQGSALNPDGEPLDFMPVIANEVGVAQIEISRREGAAGVAATGPLLVLQFEAIARGAAQVQLSNVRLTNSAKQQSAVAVHAATVTIE